MKNILQLNGKMKERTSTRTTRKTIKYKNTLNRESWIVNCELWIVILHHALVFIVSIHVYSDYPILILAVLLFSHRYAVCYMLATLKLKRLEISQSLCQLFFFLVSFHLLGFLGLWVPLACMHEAWVCALVQYSQQIFDEHKHHIV